LRTPQRLLPTGPDDAGTPFTDFASVTPDTPLAALNLNWRERDLPEPQRTKHVHRLHPYLGKFIPQLAEIFLRKFRPRTVCDPFVGSGTTLVEANALGIASVGVDISPFNCLIAKAKTDRYDLLRLAEEIRDILARTRELCTDGVGLADASSSTPLPARRRPPLRRCGPSTHSAGSGQASSGSPRAESRGGNPHPRERRGERQTQRLLSPPSCPPLSTSPGKGEASERRALAPSPSSPYLLEWYHPHARAALLAFLRLIPNYHYQDLLKVILCRAARSARLTTHFELDFPRAPQREPYYCHKHKRICLPTTDAAKFLRRYALDTLRRVAQFAALRTDAPVSILCADSQQAALPPFDMILTSPPYVGLIDYHEQHRYAYELLSLLPEPFASIGWRGSDLHENEGREIGAASKGKGVDARRRYIEGIESALGNVARRLRPGGRACIVVGDKYGLYEGLAERLGFREETVLRRHVNRRTGRRRGDFYESILIWRKE
jgi:DNA modification methylase